MKTFSLVFGSIFLALLVLGALGIGFFAVRRNAVDKESKAYADGAELLHQPDLVTYFQTRLQAMSEFNLPIVHQIRDALVEVKPLINIGNARIFCRIS